MYLKYAHENNRKWNIRTCRLIASIGNLEYLKYAHENGCRLHAYAFHA